MNTILSIAIDSEFTDSEFISLQVVILNPTTKLFDKIFFYNEDYNFIENVLKEHNHETVIQSINQNDCLILDNFLKNYIKEKKLEIKEIHVLFFYSIKDIIFSFGFDSLEDLLKGKSSLKKGSKKDNLEQTRFLRGCFSLGSDPEIKYILKDLRG